LGATGPANLKAINARRQRHAQEFSEQLSPILDRMIAQRLPRRVTVARLNALGIKTSMGGAWSLGQLQRVLSRLPS
jgi:hypothetical protein